MLLVMSVLYLLNRQAQFEENKTSLRRGRGSVRGGTGQPSRAPAFAAGIACFAAGKRASQLKCGNYEHKNNTGREYKSCIPDPCFIYLLENSASVKDAVEQEEQQKILPGISDKIDGDFFQTIGARI